MLYDSAFNLLCYGWKKLDSGPTLSEAISSMGRSRNGSLLCVLVKATTGGLLMCFGTVTLTPRGGLKRLTEV